MITNRKCVLPFIVVSLILLAYLPTVFAQNQFKICPLGSRPVPEGLKIRSVKIEGRRGARAIEERLNSALVGKTYTSNLHTQAMEDVENALTDESNQGFEKLIGIVGGATKSKGGIVAVYTTPCVKVDMVGNSVEVIVRVMFFRVDLDNFANNLLNIPRSIKPSFYNKMFAPLRVFNPKADVSIDRETGITPSLSLSTNLLSLPSLIKGEKPKAANTRLDLSFNGQKSLNQPYYDTKTDISLSHTRTSALIQKLNFQFGFAAKEKPLGTELHAENKIQVEGQIKLRPRTKIVNTIFAAGGYNRRENRVYNANQLTLDNKENVGSFRGFIDGKVFDGFTRLGVWIETSSLRRSNVDYHKVAAILGYQKEIGTDTQTYGIEFLIGGGKLWGDLAPSYAKFFGGNNSKNFLYDGIESASLSSFPVGPLIRSYGQSRAGKNFSSNTNEGARSYWQSSLNLTIPIRKWSRPLIPDEEIPFENSPPKKLREVLEGFSIGSAIGGIADDLTDGIMEDLMRQNPSLSEDEALEQAVPIAEARAKIIVEKDIAPPIRFIARRANLYSIKPLIMMDAARMNFDGGVKSQTRFAIGGGLQLTLVLASAEFGYMRTLPGRIGEQKGNFVFRFVLQNLF